MTTTATDYAITKRGMSPPLRKRDKPLRTYGKRPQATATSTEPPAKRRKSSESDEATTVTAEKVDQKRPVVAKTATEACRAEPTPAPAPKGSILSYFARVETKTVAPPAKEEEEEKDDESQQASSPQQATRRKPRILRLRAHTATPADDTNTSPPPMSKQTRSSREPLEESTGSAGNAQARPASTGSKRKASAPVVQTTLNISPQAAFSECKVCDTVWNPLFPDDVKYHQKRHKTMLALKRRREGAVEEL
ncbi:hypothetical protein CC79DRAFT_1395265 [Sarocladium strictum]